MLDLAPERLENALALGATSATVPDDAGLASVRARQHRRASRDRGFGIARGPARRTRAGVVLLGLPHGGIELDVRAAVVADLVSSSAHACLADLPAAVAALSARPADRLIVGRVVPLERVIADGLVPLAEGRVRGKVIVSIESG